MARSQPGTSSYSGTTDSPPVTAAPFTWVCFGTINNLTDDLSFVDLNNTADSGNYFYMDSRGDQPGDPVMFGSFAVPPSVGMGSSTTTPMVVGAWTHLCGVEASATSHAVYLDGANKGTSTTSVVPSGINRFTIGAFRGSTSIGFLNGLVAKVAIWNAALTDSEVASLAAGAHPRTIRGASLIFYAPLMGDRDPEIDMVGNRSLTLSNSTKAESKPGLIRGGWR